MTCSSLRCRFGIHERPAGTTSRAVIRLAFCTNNFQIGGTELNAVRWAERLSPERFQLTVVHFRTDGPLRARYERIGTKLVHVPLRNMYGPRAVHQGIRLARFLARARIDVFHAHDIYSNIFGVLWARVAGVPAVVASRRWWHPSQRPMLQIDRKSTRLNSSHVRISYAVFCLKKK